MTHICVSKLIIIGSDNGLAPGRCQAIIWINAGILLTGPLGRNFSETLTGIQTFSFKKMHLKMSSAKWCPFCLGLNVLMPCNYYSPMLRVTFQSCCLWCRSWAWWCPPRHSWRNDVLPALSESSPCISAPTPVQAHQGASRDRARCHNVHQECPQTSGNGPPLPDTAPQSWGEEKFH